MAFRGSGGGSRDAIYTDISGELTRVIAINDVLDGKVISAFVGELSLSREQIAFITNFTDSSKGIYVATLVPEPSPGLGILLLGACGITGIIKCQRK